MPDENDDQGKLNVRMSRSLLGEIDASAKEMAMNRSEWVIKACEDQLARYRPRPRVIQVERRQGARVPPSLCTHPMQMRSEKVSGESVCFACGSVVKPYG